MNTKDAKILIVDPDVEWGKRLSKVLHNGSGYEVVVPNPLDANWKGDVWKKIANDDFSVVVTAISFDYLYKNDKMGLELVKKTKRKNTQAEIVVVAKYKNTPKKILMELRDLGVDLDYVLSKDATEEEDDPFTNEKFKDVVFSAMDVHDIFIIMPFAENYKPIFGYIKDVSEKLEKRWKRADIPSKTNEDKIMVDIQTGIHNADVIVADLSELNPNVLFEVGISYSLEKKVVLLARKDDEKEIPEILSRRHIIFYETKIGGERALKKDLEKRLSIEFNRKKDFKKPNLTKNSCFVVSPSWKDGVDSYKSIIKPALPTKLPHTYLWNEKEWRKQGSKTSKADLIETALCTSCIFIADLSADISTDDVKKHEAISFYLAGMAYASSQVKCLFLYRKNVTPPFDIRDLNLLRYSKESEDAREKAKNALKDILITWKDECSGVKEESVISNSQKKNINILFLEAEPDDLIRLAIGREFREIQEEIRKSKYRDQLHLEAPQFALRARDFTARLLETKAKILHFSGHGSRAGELLFEDEMGESVLIGPRILGDLFSQLQNKIQCVILNACYSEKQAQAIAEHIDYVIGMRQSISDKAAIDFSIGFYQALGAGKTIEEAFKLGKTLSGLQNSNEFDTPILLGKAVKK